MKIEIIIAFLLTVTVISGCISLQPPQAENEKSCFSDADCACGVHIETKECFYGNRKYVDASKQCPDFCSGIAGNLGIKCIDQECRQVLII